MTRESNSGAGKADGNVASKLQAEMLHLELIDAVGEIQGEEAALPTTEPTAKEIAPVTMDTYRPKRPTTLNLFPQVPRTQVPRYPPLLLIYLRSALLLRDEIKFRL